MPDDVKTEDQPHKTDAAPATDEGKDTQTTEPNLEDLLQDKRVVAEIDRRVTSAMQKAETKKAEAVKAATERAKREAEEARLLEKEDLKGLLELKTKEAEEAQARLEQYERDQKVGALLDKKGVVDPEVRAIFLRVGGDLSEIDAAIDKMQAGISAQVEKVVNERLKTDQPPRGEKPKKEAAKSLPDQIRDAEMAKNFELSLRLKNQYLAEQRKQRVPVGTPESYAEQVYKQGT